MTDVTLFDYWRSSAAYRVRIALNLKGVDYEAVSVDLLKADHRSPENMARNPQGLVPSLAVDGLMLTQSLAIIEYLDETRPAPALLPADAAGKARVRALSAAIAMEIHPVCNLTTANRIVELAGGGDETRVAWMHENIGKGLTAFEAMLGDGGTGRFCHGDDPGMADCCLIPQIYNARRWGAPLANLPRINAILAVCEAMPAFDSARPEVVEPKPG